MKCDGKEESWQYKIGRTTLAGILPALLPFLLLGGISVWLYLNHNGIFIFTGLFSCILLIILLAILYRSLFIKNWIGEQGIYHQSKPGNGHYYPYNEIAKAAHTGGDTLSANQYYSCTFQTVDGQSLRFSFAMYDIEGVEYFIRHVSGEDGDR